MQLYSTRNHNMLVSFEEAVFTGLAPDGGLFMPTNFLPLSKRFFDDLTTPRSFNDIAADIAIHLLKDEIPEADIRSIIEKAYTFDAPLKKLDEKISILELFHGPTMAFKDFGAQFMARVMEYFLKKQAKEITILVATSGDTGGAVAHAFHNVEGIRVVLLYPKGKVSTLQEQQLTTLGGNITALEIDGRFDDCQSMVKQAFTDEELSKRRPMTTANSINIARLLPQTFYYFSAYNQLVEKAPMTIAVPSGNFGNLTAGVIAQRMGLPIKHFIAATNKNDTFPRYLESGNFEPRPSEKTISNAMDVGNPSNFERIQELYDHSTPSMQNSITSHAVSEDATKSAMIEVAEKYNYTVDPHGAVAYDIAKAHNDLVIILETAHAAKFKETVDDVLSTKIELPERLAATMDKEKQAIPLKNSFDELKAFLLSS